MKRKSALCSLPLSRKPRLVIELDTLAPDTLQDSPAPDPSTAATQPAEWVGDSPNRADCPSPLRWPSSDLPDTQQDWAGDSPDLLLLAELNRADCTSSLDWGGSELPDTQLEWADDTADLVHVDTGTSMAPASDVLDTQQERSDGSPKLLHLDRAAPGSELPVGCPAAASPASRASPASPASPCDSLCMPTLQCLVEQQLVDLLYDGVASQGRLSSAADQLDVWDARQEWFDTRFSTERHSGNQARAAVRAADALRVQERWASEDAAYAIEDARAVADHKKVVSEMKEAYYQGVFKTLREGAPAAQGGMAPEAE